MGRQFEIRTILGEFLVGSKPESLTADCEILTGVMPIPPLGVTILRHLSDQENLVTYTVTFRAR